MTIFLPLAALAAAALLLRKKSKVGHVTIDRPSQGGAAGLPRPNAGKPATGSKPGSGSNKPGSSNTGSPGNSGAGGKQKRPPGGVLDNLPIRSPGQPTGPGAQRPVDPVTGGPVVPGAPSPELLKRVADTLATGNIALIRALAREVRAMGFGELADELEKAANALELVKNLPVEKIPVPDVTPPPVAAKPVPGPVPELPREVAPPDEVEDIQFDPDPRRNLALQVQRHMNTHPGDTYDKELIKRWQTQEACKPADGLYGYCSGIAFLKYKLAPPKPRTTLTAAKKKLWKDQLNWQATRIDPVRAAEYRAAAAI